MKKISMLKTLIHKKDDFEVWKKTFPYKLTSVGIPEDAVYEVVDEDDNNKSYINNLAIRAWEWGGQFLAIECQNDQFAFLLKAVLLKQDPQIVKWAMERPLNCWEVFADAESAYYFHPGSSQCMQSILEGLGMLSYSGHWKMPPTEGWGVVHLKTQLTSIRSQWTGLSLL